MPQRYRPFSLAVRGQPFRFPAKFPLLFLFPVPKMNLALRVPADFDETALFHPIGVNGGRQMIAEFLLGASVLALVVFPRDDFHVFPARQNGRLFRPFVAVRNLHEIRHRGHALCNMRVEFAVETDAVRARVLAHFGKEQRVESGALRAVRATPCFRDQRCVLLRERHGFEAEIDVVCNPRLQTRDRNEAEFRIACAIEAIEATAQRFFLDVGREFGNEERVLDADLSVVWCQIAGPETGSRVKEGLDSGLYSRV